MILSVFSLFEGYKVYTVHVCSVKRKEKGDSIRVYEISVWGDQVTLTY